MASPYYYHNFPYPHYTDEEMLQFQAFYAAQMPSIPYSSQPSSSYMLPQFYREDTSLNQPTDPAGIYCPPVDLSMTLCQDVALDPNAAGESLFSPIQTQECKQKEVDTIARLEALLEGISKEITERNRLYREMEDYMKKFLQWTQDVKTLTEGLTQSLQALSDVPILKEA